MSNYQAASDHAAIAHASYLDCSEVFCDHVDGAFFAIYGDWAVVVTGMPFADLNFLVPVPSVASMAGFAEAHERLLDTGLPHVISLRSDIDTHLADAVTDLGYEESERAPAMVAVDTPLKPWPVELERIDGLDAREDHIGVLMAAFGVPREAVDRLTSKAVIEDERVDVIVGVEDGNPVTTALGVTVNGVCGVFNVATLESHRGRGYGAALSSEVMRLGRERGTTVASLQSSQIGLSVYEGLGFETVFTYIHSKASG